MSKSLRSSYESSNYSFNSPKKFIKITSTGNLDLELTLLLSSQEAELFGVFPDKINTITDCEDFLNPLSKKINHMTSTRSQCTNSNIFDFIRLSSENMSINSLLVLNRVSNKKAFIEYILLSDVRFKLENAFLKGVVKTVCENNFLFLVENNLIPNLNSRIKFIIKIDNKAVKEFENICENSSNVSNEDSVSGSHHPQIKNEFDGDEDKNYFDDKDKENESNYEANENARVELSKLTQNSEIKEKLITNKKAKESNENDVEVKIDSDKIIKTSSNFNNNIRENLGISGSKVNEKNDVNNLTPSKTKKTLSRNSVVTDRNHDSIRENENKQSYSNKNSVNYNLNFEEQLIADQAALSELKKELAQNQSNNEHENQSNFNNELEQSTNKKQNLIPNETLKQNAMSTTNINDDLENLSKVSLNNHVSKEKESNPVKAPEDEDESSKINESLKPYPSNNNNIIIQENSYVNVHFENNQNQNQIQNKNNQEIKHRNKNNLIDKNINVSKSKHCLKSQNQSLRTTSKLNTLKSPRKNNSLNESPIKVNKVLNYSNSKAKQQSKNSLNNSSKKNSNYTSTLSMPENEAESAYEKFNYDFSASDYFFIDLNDIIALNTFNFSLSKFNSLLAKITETHKQTKIVINFPNVMSKMASLDLPAINGLADIISLTDIFLFEKKDALALFSLLAQNNSESPNSNEKKNLENFFIKEIKKKRKALPKIGIFLDGFVKATIIEQQGSSNLILFHTDYEFSFIPRSEAKSVAETYKRLLVVHAENLKSIFFGGLFSRLIYKKPFPAAFTAANESLRKMLELKRFGREPPLDPGFYLVKTLQDSYSDLSIKRASAIEEKTKQRKEQRFVLDCGNVMNSKIKEYNSLFDVNLSAYFSSPKIRSHLHQQGFISKSNEIIEDPDAKKLGLIDTQKLSKLYEEEKANLLKIKDKQEKLRLQIKNLVQSDNLVKSGNMREIESLTKVFNFSPQAIKRLPKQPVNFNNKLNISLFEKELQRKINFRSSELTFKQVENKIKQASKGKRGFAPAKSSESQRMLLQALRKIEDSINFDAEFDLGSSFKGSFTNIFNSTSLGRSCGTVILEEQEIESDRNFVKDGGIYDDYFLKNKSYNAEDNKEEFIKNKKSVRISIDCSKNLSKVEEGNNNISKNNQGVQEEDDKTNRDYYGEDINSLNTGAVNLNLNSDTNEKKINLKISSNDLEKSQRIRTNSDDSYSTSKENKNVHNDSNIEKEVKDAEENEKNRNLNTNARVNPIQM